MNVIIFSKNRACQLDATIRSFKENCLEANACGVYVLYTSSSEEYEKGYLVAKRKHKSVDFIKESDFWLDLNSIMKLGVPNDNLVMFLVDDIVFKDKFSLRDKQFLMLQKYNEVVSLSLRLWNGITSCYATGVKNTIPAFSKGCAWNWRNDNLKNNDWGYPMSVDGNVFRYDSMKSFLEALNFKSPNTLEATMHQIAVGNKTIPTVMLCYPQGSKLFNIPANRVQNSHNNRFEDNSLFDQKIMNDKFLAGEQVSLSPFKTVKNDTVHFPCEYVFEKNGE
jgi:hypothetical protein